MSVVDFPVTIIPGLQNDNRSSSGSSTADNVTLDAANDKHAVIFQAPKTGNITSVHFRVSAKTTDGDVDLRLETVSAVDGKPTGTLLATNTNKSVTINAANTSYEAVLTAAAPVTMGDIVALVYKNVSGSYGLTASRGFGGSANFPYFVNDLSGAGYGAVSPISGTNVAWFVLEYDDGSFAFIPLSFPWSAVTGTAFNSGSSPNEKGMNFTLEVGVRAIGIYCAFAMTTGGTAELILYDSAGAVLRTIAIDTTKKAGTTSQGANYYLFTSKVEIPASTGKITFKATSATPNATVYEYEVLGDGLDQMGFGSDWTFTSRTGAGPWTDDPNRHMFIGLVIDGIVIPGGGIASPAIRSNQWHNIG